MSKPKVFVTCKVVGNALDRLRTKFDVITRDETTPATREELIESARQCEALLCYIFDTIDADVLQNCPKLKVVGNIAVGFDNIDVVAATKRHVLVLNTPGVLTNATADLTFGLLIAAARRVVEADRYVRQRQWTGWSVDLMLGHELTGKTLGIVGLGRIGEAVAKRAAAFGMNIIYTRKGNEEKDRRLLTEYSAVRVSLGELLKKSDFISVHCPLAPETRHLLGKTEFARMKPECVLVNTARGAVLDQAALIEALQKKQIAGAALDVFDGEPDVPKELLEMENVVLSPHMGSATVETRAAMANVIVDGVLRAFEGQRPENLVNADAWQAPSRKTVASEAP